MSLTPHPNNIHNQKLRTHTTNQYRIDFPLDAAP
nr:MAG TPA: hypothetical protein [Caudoviricetes sp.]